MDHKIFDTAHFCPYCLSLPFCMQIYFCGSFNLLDDTLKINFLKVSYHRLLNGYHTDPVFVILPAVTHIIHLVAAVVFSNQWKPTRLLHSPLLNGILHHKLLLFILCWPHDFDFGMRDGIKGADGSVKLIWSSRSIYYSITSDSDCKHRLNSQ